VVKMLRKQKNIFLFCGTKAGGNHKIEITNKFFERAAKTK
jgi:hypothetical protein